MWRGTTTALEEPQPKAKSKAKGKSTGNGDEVETLLKRADKASEERKAMIQPKSKQEMVVNQFFSYLTTRLIQVKPELSFDFTMDRQRLFHTYVTLSDQISSASSGVYHQHQLPYTPQQPIPAYPQRSLSTPPGSVSYIPFRLVTGYGQQQYGQYLPQTPGCYKHSYSDGLTQTSFCLCLWHRRWRLSRTIKAAAANSFSFSTRAALAYNRGYYTWWRMIWNYKENYNDSMQLPILSLFSSHCINRRYIVRRTGVLVHRLVKP